MFFCDAYLCCKSCVSYQNVGNLRRRNQILQTPILVSEIFDVLGINFMGPFPLSFENSNIILAMDYISKWMKTKVTLTNNAKIVVDFIKANIFSRCGTSKVIISDRGTHFCNKVMKTLFKKYNTAYYAQTNG